MDDLFIARGRSRRKAQEVINMHHFQVELFYSVIDMQLQELNDHFTEASIESLLCPACLYFEYLFSSTELMRLNNHLEAYSFEVRSSMNLFN